MEEEKKARVQLTDEQRFEKYLQAVETALARLAKVRGVYDPLVVEAAREALHRRVDQDLARIATTEQLTLFEQLEARAEEIRAASEKWQSKLAVGGTDPE